MPTKLRILDKIGILLIICLCIGDSSGYCCGWTTANHFSTVQIASKLKSCVKYYYTRREIKTKVEDLTNLLLKEPLWLGQGIKGNLEDLGTYITNVEDYLDKFRKTHEKRGYVTMAEHRNFTMGFLPVTYALLEVKMYEIEVKAVELTSTLLIKQKQLIDEEETTRQYFNRTRRLMGHLASSHIWLTPFPGNEARDGPDVPIFTSPKGSPYFKPHLFDIKSLETLQKMFSKLSKMNCSLVRNESILLEIMRKYPQEHIKKTKLSDQEYTCTKLKFQDIPSTILTHKLSLEQYSNFIYDLNEEIAHVLVHFQHVGDEVRRVYGAQRIVIFDQHNSLVRSLQSVAYYYVKSDDGHIFFFT